MFSDNLRMAIKSVRSRRLRSFITLLGVIIGVVGVITSVSLAEGVKQQVARETTQLGGDVLTIRPGVQLNQNRDGIISGISFLAPNSTSSILSEKDLAAIRDTDGVRLSVPLNLITGVPAKDDKTSNESVTIGTTTGLLNLLNQDVEFGKFFDENSNHNFAVIGSSIASELFAENAPIGQGFTLRGKEFIVQGVLEKQRVASFSQGIDFNKAVFIPYGTAKEMSGTAQSFEILAQVNHIEEIDDVAAQIEENLADIRGGQKDFTILKVNDTRAVADSVVNLIGSMIGIIAVIAMVVGGVGIMNVMLVSVTEREHEIGIRKAVGATDSQIAGQFMIEAVVLSTWGAMLGIFIAGLINAAFRVLTEIQPAIVWEVMLFAGLLSIVIGVVFGAAPAIKAARKNPIDALRSDS